MDERESNLRKTGERNGGWTVETLREYVISIMNSHDEKYEQAFSAQKEAVNAALAAADRAVAKAESASEKRFDSVNEFRNTLADQQRTLMPRSEIEVIIKSINDKIDAIQKSLNTFFGTKGGIKEGWGYAVGALGFIFFILSLFGVFGKISH